MKALVLAAGSGTRFAKGSNAPVHKCLAKIGDRHVVDFSLETAARLGVEEIVMVIGHLGETVMDAFHDSYQGIPITYAVQTEQHGLVSAMACGEAALAKADFWLFLADEVLVGADHDRMLHEFCSQQAFVICGMVTTDNLELVRKNYSIDFDANSRRIVRLLEKPGKPFNSFIGTGNCVFKNEIFTYIKTMPIDSRTGKKELVGLIQAAIGDGRKVLSHNFPAKFYSNVNTCEDYADLQAVLNPSAAMNC